MRKYQSHLQSSSLGHTVAVNPISGQRDSDPVITSTMDFCEKIHMAGESL